MRIMYSLIAIVCFLAGNYLGDWKTTTDCTTRGQARMMSGETVVCELRRMP